MTLVLIGPVCEDLIIIGDEKSSKVGGASYYQSFVYEEFYNAGKLMRKKLYDKMD